MVNNLKVKYLRVSLLDSCNFRCFYCRPSGFEQTDKIDRGKIGQFQKAIDLFCKIGINKIRFTGGEPTLFTGLAELIAYTRSQNSNLHIGMTSNGLLLDLMAGRLAQAGLDSVNISLDTIDEKKFKRITGIDRFNQVLAGIISAQKHIPSVKLNCVLIKGVNDDEVAGMIDFANQLGVSIRFIEYMPSKNISGDRDRYVSGDDIRRKLPFKLEPIAEQPNGAARYFRAPGLNIRVGFISAVSHPFCAACDRIRLSSDGRLYSCLFSAEAVDLFALLERGIEPALTQIDELVRRKKYLGCAGAFDSPDDLPSFINLGG